MTTKTGHWYFEYLATHRMDLDDKDIPEDLREIWRERPFVQAIDRSIATWKAYATGASFDSMEHSCALCDESSRARDDAGSAVIEHSIPANLHHLQGMCAYCPLAYIQTCECDHARSLYHGMRFEAREKDTRKYDKALGMPIAATLVSLLKQVRDQVEDLGESDEPQD